MKKVFFLAFTMSAFGAWEEGAGFRRLPVNPPDGKPGFTQLVNASIGVAFTNKVSDARALERRYLFNGAGVAIGDFDRDGKPDIFLCNKEGPSALYRNLGNWRFEEVTATAGVACADQSSTGATFADINGDGWIDLLVTSFGGPNALFLNQRNGTFTNITSASGFTFRGQTTSMALGDVDGDGFLDLYADVFPMVSVLHDGVSVGTRMVNGVSVPTGRYASRIQIINGRMTEVGEPHLFYRNSAGNRFVSAAWPETFFDQNGKGISAPQDFGLAVQMRDIDGDGLPDIYVCNDFQTPDRVWLNDGHGKFRSPAGAWHRSMSFASMGVDFADINRDGFMDMIVVEMLASDPSRRLRQENQSAPYSRTPGVSDDVEDVYRNTLFLNNGDGSYSEIARLAGLAASDWSWCPIFLDVDLDGYEDLLVTNGNADDVNNLDDRAPSSGAAKRPRTMKPLLTANRAFRNQRDLTFADAGATWGFDSMQISHGMSLGDFDGDGDQDVVVNCWNAPPLIYKNNANAPRILVRLKGRGANTQGIGSLVTMRNANGFTQSQEIVCGGRYLSGDDPARTFACVGEAPFALEVRWRSGRVSTIPAALPNSIYEIDEPDSAPAARSITKPPEPIFADISDTLNHTHHQPPFDDFTIQPLLPRRLNQMGPAIACADLNGDGRLDLLIGDAAYANTPSGFQKIDAPGLSGDVRSIVVLPGPTPKVIYASDRVWLTDLKTREEIKLPNSMTPTSLALLNSNLFVGGTALTGHFPEAADSFIFNNDNGHFTYDANRSKVFAHCGLVNAAAVADFDGDGFPDLALACEWGPIKIFLNRNGAFVEATSPEFAAKTGLWMSLAIGDFDGDGKPDIAAGNWGRNCEHEEFRAKPARLYYGDWLQRGAIDLLETDFNPLVKDWAPVRLMTVVSAALPFVKEHFPTHAAYSVASVSEILKDQKPLHFLEASWFESTLFMNRGDHWEARPLPIEAQFTPSLGMVAADFDGDGRTDLFMAQNYFATRGDVGRYDAGFGLLLRGDGKGKFTPVPASASGIRVLGEQRGVAAADFDGDGRIDLAVAQNGAATKLFRNRTATPRAR